MELKILAGNANPQLAEKIVEKIGQPLTGVQVGHFPDGEISVKIDENIRGCDVFVVQPTCSPPNDNLMELLMLMDAAKRSSAARITAVVPYFGYARQDRKEQPRVPISAKLVANLLVAAGANRLLTVDLHSQQIQGFFDIPVDHLYAAPVIIQYLNRLNLDNLVLVAPDTGGLKMAHAYSNYMQAGLAIVAKRRRSPTEVEASHLVGDVDGCNVILVDDMTATAGTLCEAARLLKDAGAKSIRAAVSHGVLLQAGLERLKSSLIEELVTTDSIPQDVSKEFPVTVVSLANHLGEAILRIHENKSISTLIKV